MKISIKYALIFFLLTNCSPKKPDYFSSYIQQVKTIQDSEQQLYVFIPTDICNQCILGIIKHLNIIEKQNLKVIFIANTHKDIKRYSSTISKIYPIIEEINDKELKKLNHIVIVIIKKNEEPKTFHFYENNLYKIINTIESFENQ